MSYALFAANLTDLLLSSSPPPPHRLFSHARIRMSRQQQAISALIKEGNLEGVRETFRVQESNGQSLTEILSSRDSERMTPFLAACQSGHLDVVVFLLEKGSSIN